MLVVELAERASQELSVEGCSAECGQASKSVRRCHGSVGVA